MFIPRCTSVNNQYSINGIPTTFSLRYIHHIRSQKETPEIVREGGGGYHQVDVTHASTGKEKKGRRNNKWLDSIRADIKQ